MGGDPDGGLDHLRGGGVRGDVVGLGEGLLAYVGEASGLAGKLDLRDWRLLLLLQGSVVTARG